MITNGVDLNNIVATGLITESGIVSDFLFLITFWVGLIFLALTPFVLAKLLEPLEKVGCVSGIIIAVIGMAIWVIGDVTFPVRITIVVVAGSILGATAISTKYKIVRKGVIEKPEVKTQKEQVNMTKQQLDSSLRPWIGCIGVSFEHEQDIVIKLKNFGAIPTLSERIRILVSKNPITIDSIRAAPVVDTRRGILYPSQKKAQRLRYDVSKITKARLGEWEANVGFLMEYTYANDRHGEYGFVAKYIYQTESFGVEQEWTR